MRPAIWALLASGCTLVNDPSAHMGNVRDASTDAERLFFSDFCDEAADLACDGWDGCCMVTEPEPGCRARLTAECDLGVEESGFDDIRAGYDPVRAATELAEGRRLVAACDPAFLGWFRDLYPNVLAGSLPLGQECTPEASTDYAALFSCLGDDNACIAVGVGFDRFLCAPRAGEGVGCLLQTDCADGLFCDAPELGVPGVCRPLIAAGSSCPWQNACEGFCFCDADRTGRCTTPGTCVALDAEQIFCNLFAPR